MISILSFKFSEAANLFLNFYLIVFLNCCIVYFHEINICVALLLTDSLSLSLAITKQWVAIFIHSLMKTSLGSKVNGEGTRKYLELYTATTHFEAVVSNHNLLKRHAAVTRDRFQIIFVPNTPSRPTSTRYCTIQGDLASNSSQASP